MGSKRFFMIAMVLLILGGLNWGYAAFYGRDFVSKVAGKKAWIVYGLVGLAALMVGFARDTYLPFLGPTVMPCSVLRDQTPEGANTSVSIQTKPGAKVLYWASEPATDPLSEIKDWRQAYLAFGNAGVVTADAQGMAKLSVRKPQAYTVPMKGRLEAHIHYRICGDGGMLGRVETTYIPSEEPFEEEVVVRNNADMYRVNYEGKYEVTREPIAPYSGEKYMMKKDVDYNYNVEPIARSYYLPSQSETNSTTQVFSDTNNVVPKKESEQTIKLLNEFNTEFDKWYEKRITTNDLLKMMNRDQLDNVYELETAEKAYKKKPCCVGSSIERFETENQKEIDSIEQIKSDTMVRINQMDTNGLDESPQPAGAPYQTAFNVQTQ